MTNILTCSLILLVPVAIYLAYVYAIPYLTLQWALYHRRVETKYLMLLEGELRVVGHDYFSDHSAWQSEQRVYRENGKLFVRQWTAEHGEPPTNGISLYVNGRRLRKGEVRQIPEGAILCQLDPYGSGAEVKRFVLLDWSKPDLFKLCA